MFKAAWNKLLRKQTARRGVHAVIGCDPRFNAGLKAHFPLVYSRTVQNIKILSVNAKSALQDARKEHNLLNILLYLSFQFIQAGKFYFRPYKLRQTDFHCLSIQVSGPVQNIGFR